MRINTSNGYVLIKEVITRKIAREYNTALFKDANMDADGDVKANPMNVEQASEALVLGLIEKIVVVDATGTESFVEPSREWLDNLPESDFKNIELEVLKMKRGSAENIKK